MNNTFLKSYLKCRRKAWLDYNGNHAHKIWSPYKAIEQITQYRNFFKFTNGELFKGIDGCKKGYMGVFGITLEETLDRDEYFKVKPALLVRTKGVTIWGEYKYIPAISKLGHKTTKEHLYDLSICSIFLEKYQKTLINEGLVISNFQDKIRTERISLSNGLKNKAIRSFIELNKSLTEKIPPITQNRKKCSICEWQGICDQEAKINGDLTDIDGIGSKTALLLKKKGIENFKTLASSKKIDLIKKLPELHEENEYRISRYIKQSKAYISGKPIKNSNKKSAENFAHKVNSGFFVCDIESNPDDHHDFLYGFLTIENISQKLRNIKYESILNLEKKDNKNYIESLFNKINSYEDYPLLHYGETEKIAFIKLAKKINLTNDEINKLKSRFIDLHLIVRELWILPIKNYSLKTVANWTGFNWTQSNVSGSKALFWWLQYKNTSEISFLKKIIQYNKDDCLATFFITRWLLNN